MRKRSRLGEQMRKKIDTKKQEDKGVGKSSGAKIKKLEDRPPHQVLISPLGRFSLGFTRHSLVAEIAKLCAAAKTQLQ